MQYFTIYRTHDSAEIAIIKHLFEDNDINFQVLDETVNGAAGIAATGGQGMRVQVEDEQVEDAKTVLLENGFLGDWKKGRERRKNMRISKWIFILMAVLVLILVSFLIMWFMNP